MFASFSRPRVPANRTVMRRIRRTHAVRTAWAASLEAGGSDVALVPPFDTWRRGGSPGPS